MKSEPLNSTQERTSRSRPSPLSRLTAGEFPILLAVMLITNLGLFIRLAWVATGDGFPLNDGGMFYAMVQDVQRSGYRLPEFTSYNGGDIPFAYPPLGLYIAAFLNDVARISSIDIFRFVPALVSTLTIPAFYLLARRLTPSRSTAVIATLLFALAPRAFNWEIVGGGLTRSFGLFFAVLALREGHRLYTARTAKCVLTTAVLSALSFLSHMEMAWFVAYSMALFFLMQGRTRRGLVDSVAVGLGVVVLTSPWWGTVISHHGVAPFLAAASSGQHSPLAWLSLFIFHFSEEALFPLIAGLGLLGIVWSLSRSRYFLPAWLLVMFVLDPRKAWTLSQIPLALLAALAVTEVILPMFDKEQPVSRRPLVPRGSILFFVALVIYGSSSAISPAETSPFLILRPEAREAMAWLNHNTEPDARFLVVTATNVWSVDNAAEWFPALTGRTSVATVQGSEWLQGDFGAKEDAYEQLQECAFRDGGCLQRWAADTGLTFTHVYLPKGSPRIQHSSIPAADEDCCPALRSSLRNSPDFKVVFDGPGATIFAR